MPDDSKSPPRPDALRQPLPGAGPGRRRTLAPTAFPAEAAPEARPQPKSAEGKEPKEKQSSGLGEMDTPHVFAGVLASGFGRAIAVGLTCMLAFGLSEACYLFSQIFEGWKVGGIKGFFSAIVAIPVAPFVSPSHFYHAISWNIGETLLGPPYLMLLVGGLVLAVRSEIHVVKLCFFYFVVGSIHAVAYFKMNNPFSLMLWGGMLFGAGWLYRKFWKLQEPEEEPAEEGIEEEERET